MFKKKLLISTVAIFAALSCHLVMAKPIKVYFGGDLFTHKDLVGNIYLSNSIANLSNGRYEFFLAQNKVQQKVDHKSIKDQDLKGLLYCDLALFAFDGTELDSGTVVEFIGAKFLDKPSVVYRTDFRGGSGEEGSETKTGNTNKWNLMVSFYPRTKIVYLNSMVEYQKVLSNANNSSIEYIAKKYSDNIARKLIYAMDEVLKTPKILNAQEYKLMNKNFISLMNIQ